jgi:hypothetical protein
MTVHPPRPDRAPHDPHSHHRRSHTGALIPTQTSTAARTAAAIRAANGAATSAATLPDLSTTTAATAVTPSSLATASAQAAAMQAASLETAAARAASPDIRDVPVGPAFAATASRDIGGVAAGRGPRTAAVGRLARMGRALRAGLWISLVVSVVLVISASLAPLLPTGTAPALAAAGPGAVALLAQNSDPGAINLESFFSNVRSLLIGLLATITVCYLTIGGIRMVIAGGDPGEVERAKAALRSGVFGFLATILAPAFVSLLQSLFGGAR